MADEPQLEQKDWRERFRAVAQAQGQYLYVLLIVGLFFAALAESKYWSLKTAVDIQDLSLLGIKVNTRTLLAAGSPVLAFLLLAALGTFPAVKYAHMRASVGLSDEKLWERLDSLPTAIDFVVYEYKDASASKRWHLGLLTYPACLWLAYIEAIVLSISSLRAYATLGATQWVMTGLGIVLLFFVAPRIWLLTRNKVRSAFCRNNVDSPSKN
ncbi:MAG: hypothetical protein IPQ13_04320 [Holophagaceae bacterium]|nr:hypothetical protein [Holophagaceae bacterium]